eukprot:COSAG02_NODE_2956_length_7669_cov_10.857860_5_plen_61_part_00
MFSVNRDISQCDFRTPNPPSEGWLRSCRLCAAAASVFEIQPLRSRLRRNGGVPSLFLSRG